MAARIARTRCRPTSWSAKGRSIFRFRSLRSSAVSCFSFDYKRLAPVRRSSGVFRNLPRLPESRCFRRNATPLPEPDFHRLDRASSPGASGMARSAETPTWRVSTHREICRSDVADFPADVSVAVSSRVRYGAGERLARLSTGASNPISACLAKACCVAPPVSRAAVRLACRVW